jgi:small subunit ribosomal protein S27Ae
VKHNPSKKHGLYEVKDGDKLDRKRKFCPKCGPGVFLAHHGNRLHCGRCGYTEFKKSEEKADKAEHKGPKGAEKAPAEGKPKPGKEK